MLGRHRWSIQFWWLQPVKVYNRLKYAAAGCWTKLYLCIEKYRLRDFERLQAEGLDSAPVPPRNTKMQSFDEGFNAQSAWGLNNSQKQHISIYCNIVSYVRINIFIISSISSLYLCSRITLLYWQVPSILFTHCEQPPNSRHFQFGNRYQKNIAAQFLLICRCLIQTSYWVLKEGRRVWSYGLQATNKNLWWEVSVVNLEAES